MSANKPVPQEITPTPGHDEKEEKGLPKVDPNPNKPVEQQSGVKQDLPK